jgi:hypothetical protein
MLNWVVSLFTYINFRKVLWMKILLSLKESHLGLKILLEEKETGRISSPESALT